MLALASCAKVQEENIDSPEEGTPVSGKSLVVNTVIPETKVTISPDGDEYKMSWDSDESAKLVERSNAAANASLYTSSAIDVTAGKAAFTFSGLIPVAGTTVYNYDILYPASAVGAATGDVIAMTMPATQTPKTASADPAAALLAGRNASDFAAQPASVNANFNHLAAYGKMTLKNLSKGSIGTVTSISITIEAEECNIAGDLGYNAETGVADYTSSSKSVITIDGTNLTYVYGGFDVWFACKPFTLPAGKKLIITTTLNETLVQTATMVAKADVDFNAGEVTEFPAFGTTYTVTFNTQGGSTIAPAYVGRGNKAKEPAAPTKTGALAAGAYLGNVTDPDNAEYTFAGWYSDSGCTTPYDFDSQVWGNTTIYAKWDSPAETLDVSAEDVGSFNAGDPAKLIYRTIQYVNAQSLDAETHYTVVMGGNGTIWDGTIPTLNKENAVVHIVGKGEERRITTSNNSNILLVQSGTLTIGKNILLNFNGAGTHDLPLLSIQGEKACVILEEGARIDGSTFGQYLVNITTSGAKFIMNGGSISNNTCSGATSTSAPICNIWGIFIMNGGTISGNSVTNTSLTANIAGGVFINNWANSATHHFIKNGGTISGNTATRSASGDITGYKGNQVLYLSPKKKLDADIAAGVNLTTMDNSCYSSPWVTANVE